MLHDFPLWVYPLLPARLPARVFFGVGIGFYDGLFGPGTGSFWTMALVVVMGCAVCETGFFGYGSAGDVERGI